jgi:hypothetical protein
MVFRQTRASGEAPDFTSPPVSPSPHLWRGGLRGEVSLSPAIGGADFAFVHDNTHRERSGKADCLQDSKYLLRG